MDDGPADPFDDVLPPELIEEIRVSMSPEEAAATELYLAEFTAGRLDYDALLDAPSWRALIRASLVLADTNPVGLATVVVHAIGRVKIASALEAGDYAEIMRWMTDPAE